MRGARCGERARDGHGARDERREARGPRAPRCEVLSSRARHSLLGDRITAREARDARFLCLLLVYDTKVVFLL